MLDMLLWLLARPLAGIFSESEAILTVAVHYLYIVPVSWRRML